MKKDIEKLENIRRIEQSVVENKVDVNERFGLWGDAKCGVSVNRLHGKRFTKWKSAWYTGEGLWVLWQNP